MEIHNFAKTQHLESINFLKLSLDSYTDQLTDLSIISTGTSLTQDGLSVRMIKGAEQVSIKKHWWGVDIIMNEKMTQDIIHGITATGPVGGAIAAAFGAAGIITGGVATVIGAGIAAVVAVKVAQIKITDNGKGVHWPITWLQWGALLAAIPGGPAGIAAAGVLFLHPIRN